MKTSPKRNIGHEILEGIKEIKDWQQGKKQLKTAVFVLRNSKPLGHFEGQQHRTM